MENKKKKVYYIRDIAKAYDNYNESLMDTVENLGTTIVFATLAAATICLPFLPILNKNMDIVDQAKSLILGIGVPSFSVPITIKKLGDTIKSRKEMNKYSKFLDKHMGDITIEDIEDYKERTKNVKENPMCLNLTNIRK